MTYEGIDKWNKEDSLEHRSHKYYMKVGEGPNARYFYSALEYAAYRAGLTKGHKPTGEQQMADIRNRRAKALYKMEANKERAGMANKAEEAARMNRESIKRKQDQTRRKKEAREQRIVETAEEAARMNRESIKRKQDQTRRKKEAREQRFKEIAEERKTDSARRAAAYYGNRIAAERKEADTERHVKQARHDSMVRARNNEGVGPITRRNVKRVANVAKYKAKDAYNSAKKTAKNINSSNTVKTAKKKAKKAVKTAYNRGRNFVNNLFK